LIEKLFDLYSDLYDEGFPVEAQRQSVCWDILMNMLDTMLLFGENKQITLLRYKQLFNILIESGEVGEIPQGLDEVKVGSADRIRTEQLKVVFLVGVNKDEFPCVSVKNGILTDSDRVVLTSLGLEIRPPFEETVEDEKFIAYCAVTAASQKLYLCYKNINNDGAAVHKSEIVETALSVIDNISVVNTNSCAPFEFVESENTAFTLLAKTFAEDSVLKSTLLTYFSDNEEYSGKLQAMYRVAGNEKISFNNETISKKLFGENMYLSASKVESFYNCPFAYFLRYGLKAEPLRVAELDPAQSGTIVHLVMETILKKYPKASFVQV
jgi:ATP-dependent helicase/nuclease subunit B